MYILSFVVGVVVNNKKKTLKKICYERGACVMMVGRARGKERGKFNGKRKLFIFFYSQSSSGFTMKGFFALTLYATVCCVFIKIIHKNGDNKKILFYIIHTHIENENYKECEKFTAIEREHDGAKNRISFFCLFVWYENLCEANEKSFLHDVVVTLNNFSS